MKPKAQGKAVLVVRTPKGEAAKYEKKYRKGLLCMGKDYTIRKEFFESDGMYVYHLEGNLSKIMTIGKRAQMMAAVYKKGARSTKAMAKIKVADKETQDEFMEIADNFMTFKLIEYDNVRVNRLESDRDSQ